MTRRSALLGAAGMAAIPTLPDPIAAALPRPAAAAPLPRSTVLFRAGDGGYASFRIPAVVTTPAGTICAFAEARWTASSDSGDINIAWRRVHPGATEWTPMSIVLSLGHDTVGNPTVVLDPSSGDLVLLVCRNSATDGWSNVVTGNDPPRTVYVMRCANPDAASPAWSAAVEIPQVRRSAWRWYATGPGAGAVITVGPHAGRIVIPCNHSSYSGATTGLGQHLIYSDGGGHPGTWRIGAVSSNFDSFTLEDETAICTLADGQSLYVNCRTGPKSRQPGNRADGYSTDGGVTYAAPGVLVPQASIVTGECQGQVLTLPDGRLVYSGPSLPPFVPVVLQAIRDSGVSVTPRSARAAMALRVSEDEGRSWRLSRQVSGLPAAYSAMTLVDPLTLGLLYETGYRSAYERIEWAEISLTELR